MPNCPECDTPLDFEVDEVDEGDIVACDECGTEFEIVGTEPIEQCLVGLAHRCQRLTAMSRLTPQSLW